MVVDVGHGMLLDLAHQRQGVLVLALEVDVEDDTPATGGSETITHFSVGKAVSGATDILYHGTVTPNIAVSDGVTPSLTTATAITED